MWLADPSLSGSPDRAGADLDGKRGLRPFDKYVVGAAGCDCTAPFCAHEIGRMILLGSALQPQRWRSVMQPLRKWLGWARHEVSQDGRQVAPGKANRDREVDVVRADAAFLDFIVDD